MATTLQLIVPVYNEHENFPRLVEQVEQQLAPPFRMLVVYDFDEDTTVPVARDLAASRPWLELVRNDLGRGRPTRSAPALQPPIPDPLWS